MQKDIYIFKDGKKLVQSRYCLASWWEESDDFKSTLSVYKIGPHINPINVDLAKRYLRNLKRNKLVVAPVDKNFIVSFDPKANSAYIKANLFPVRVIWENPKVVEDTLYIFDNYNVTFIQAYALGIRYNKNLDLAYVGHHYTSSGLLSSSFREKLGKVMSGEENPSNLSSYFDYIPRPLNKRDILRAAKQIK